MLRTRADKFRGSLKDIRLFVAVYEHRSFTTAAIREHTTQSGVSHHIRRLENVLGSRLFNRDGTSITPTPAADLLYAKFVGTIRSVDEANDIAARFAVGHAGHVRLAVSPALTPRILAPAVLEFSRENPNVKLEIIESYSTILSSLVKGALVDCAIGAVTEDDVGLRTTALFHGQECLFSRACDNASVRCLGDFSNRGPHNLVFTTGWASRRRAIDACLEANGIAVGSVLEMDSTSATLDLIRRSDWKNVSPAVAMDPDLDTDIYCVVPLTDPELSMEFRLIEPATAATRPEVSALVALVVSMAKRSIHAWKERFARL